MPHDTFTPLPSKLSDLTPGQLHSLEDFRQAVFAREQVIVGAGNAKMLTPGQTLRSTGFREAYNVLYTTPDRHERGKHKAGSPLAIALEQFGYRPVYATWDVGDTPTTEGE